MSPPADWLVLISDVQGSTKAIEQGKYKIVNMVGASTIAAVSNVLQTMEFPFVFGGDGATALLPGDRRLECEKALRAVRRNSLETYGITLRLGLVPVRDLQAEGYSIEVAKFALGGGPCIAFFRGQGMVEAEKRVKSGRYHVEDGPEVELSEALQGLSCRWAPLASARGCMLSVIVKARSGDTVLSMVLAKIDTVARLSDIESHPVKPETMKPEGFRRASDIETSIQQLRPRWRAKAIIILQMIAMRVMRRLNLGVHGMKFRDYLRDNLTHSDYRKYDDMLRMVFDCTPDTRDKVLAILGAERAEGKIYYGVFESKSALLTCFVKNFGKGNHIHFVDGNDGGYALAAKQLKEQMSAEAQVVGIPGA